MALAWAGRGLAGTVGTSWALTSRVHAGSLSEGARLSWMGHQKGCLGSGALDQAR